MKELSRMNGKEKEIKRDQIKLQNMEVSKRHEMICQVFCALSVDEENVDYLINKAVAIVDKILEI